MNNADNAIPDHDPLALFADWFAEAHETEPNDANAMALATATPEALPSVRMVLLKGLDAAGFVFYTNYLSRKGQEIAGSAQVSLLFPWHMLERQVKVTGVAARLDEAASTDYFASRPRDSQLAAWASPQSEPLPSRTALLARLESVKTRFGDGPVPRPPHWGGFRVQPHSIDFWQGGAHRLHDSFRYAREGTGAWQLTRVAP